MSEWIAELDPDGDGSWIVHTSTPLQDGEVWLAYGLTKEKAHLIAAAPDMLAALSCICYSYSTDPAVWQEEGVQARAAIAKALGESK